VIDNGGRQKPLDYLPGSYDREPGQCQQRRGAAQPV